MRSLPLRKLAFCIALLSPELSAAQAVLPVAEVQLRPGDAVRVEVKDEPELGGTYPVDVDGYVLMPVVGRVRVADRPFGVVRADLAAAYAEVLSEPVVQLTPLLRIAVLGEVRQPGLLTVDPTHTLADVLALAGGLSPSASRRGISVVREGSVVAARLDPGRADARVSLRSGDQIFVRRRSWLGENPGVLIGAAASVAAAAVTSLIIR